jgi:hypothetical protein
MTTKLPMDANDNPIPALRLKDGGAHTLAVTSSSARNATAFADETRVVSLYSTVDITVKFGDNATTASTTDHFFPAGVYYDVAIGGDGTGHSAYIAALAASSDGTLYMSEKE